MRNVAVHGYFLSANVPQTFVCFEINWQSDKTSVAQRLLFRYRSLRTHAHKFKMVAANEGTWYEIQHGAEM